MRTKVTVCRAVSARAAAAAALLGAALNGGEARFAAWEWRADVTAPPGRFAALVLTPEMCDACARPDLSDLRLADADGREVPYAIAAERDIEELVAVKGKELNREQVDPATSRLTVDFGAPIVKNRLAAATSGTNFVRRVRVEGSDDQQAWVELLKDGIVAAVAGQPERFETIDLGADNNYRFVRVSVRKMAEEEAAPEIGEVRCWRRVVVTAAPAVHERTLAGGLVEYTHDGVRRTSTASVDFAHRHLPIARLGLVLAGDPGRVFRRSCRVLGRNSLEHEEAVKFETGESADSRLVATPWVPAGAGTVSRDAEGRENLTLAVRAPYRYVRIEIENGDSPPLALAAIQGICYATYAVFQPAGETRFAAYLGNAEAGPPRYEVEALAAVDLRTVPKAAAGELVAQKPAGDKEPAAGQAFVWVLMALAVLATVALLWWSAMRGRKPEQAPEAPAPPPGADAAGAA
ncbi:MAG TPA: hypothetical protein DCM87_03660 [Planctomycetes bacterium]|nr:hypothetical protein [Planctomycetota bacterium]